MSRYYDIDKLKQMIEAKADTLIEGKEAFLYVAKWIDFLPTADVVPRAEVMRLVGEYYDKCDECRSKIADTVRAEVAKEIFEEIITTAFSKMPSDVLMVGRDYDFTDGVRMGKREAIIDMINILAELKKKYTEGKE